MHISARPSNAGKVAQIVFSTCKEEKVRCKIFSIIPAIRFHYSLDRFAPAHLFSQRGKFIAIYPDTDDEAKRVAESIDKKFKAEGLTREDFISIFGDFQVGETGGIYARLCHYDDPNNQSRECPNIAPDILSWHAKSNHFTPENYPHPFKTLGLWFNGRPLPEKVWDIVEKVKYNYNFELIMKDPPAGAPTTAASSS
ncbi:hypothetical protein FACS1894122_06080 [Alphaproteobacteria bacterium]|nr:hypothetical protein FACS1894122_06080 [Alphaproteobacteria bacterium]